MMAHLHAHAIKLLNVSIVSAGIAWMPNIDLYLRMAASLIACVSGLAALVYYGKQNGWWK